MKDFYEEIKLDECIKKYPQFSVAMCVYGGDNAKWFGIALDSVINQIVQPSEIVLVVDGVVPQSILDVIDKYEKICRQNSLEFKVIKLPENQGHGNARRCSVKYSTYDIVALMDADDICMKNRFKDELNALIKTKADIVGGDIAEFIDNVDTIVGYRKVSIEDSEIKRDIRKRCPFNQVTVMFKKGIYEEAGGYIDWYYNEDYYLWIRMMQSGARFTNTGTVLVKVRVGKEMYQRRGGLQYFRSEAKLQKYMLEKHIISIPEYIVNCLKRVIVQVLLPNKARGWVFRKFARKSK